MRPRATDRWIAITFDSAAAWHALSQTSDGVRALTQRPATLRCASGAHRESDIAAVDDLQELGIAAGVVQDMQDLFERDPLIQARHSLVPLEHPILGTFGHMRTPIDFSRSRPQPFRAPSIGEHNRQIAAALCGLSAARIDELQLLGVFK